MEFEHKVFENIYVSSSWKSTKNVKKLSFP